MDNKCIINNTFAAESVFSCVSYSIFAYIKKLRFTIALVCYA
ncbi:hypothetical protein AB9Q04_00225 [Anaerococcus sp. ENR1011]|uniref:Uncharacterized protein n=1 Tax=Anaerococcus groningensis TaxID=3115616 RepID=A0ABW9MY95_9FIRM